MKKIFLYTSLVSILVLLLASCGPTAKEKEEARTRRSKTPNVILWDTIAVSKSQALDSKAVQASSIVTINLIVPKAYEKEEVLKSLLSEINFEIFNDESYSTLSTKEGVDKYMTNYFENYKKESKSQLALWNKLNGKNVFSYDKTIESQVLYNEANLISYQITTTETKGDATTTTSVRNLLLDLNEGKLLHQSDIFEKGTKEKVNEALIKQIMKDNDVKQIEDLQALGYWGVADLAINNNFYVDKDGITYTFNPDEYSDANLGVLKVFIGYDDLMDYFKKESPITILIQDL